MAKAISYRNFDHQSIASLIRKQGSATIELSPLRGALLQHFLIRFEALRGISSAKHSGKSQRVVGAFAFSGLTIFLGLFFPKLMSIAEFVMDRRVDVEIIRSDKVFVVITGEQLDPGSSSSH